MTSRRKVLGAAALTLPALATTKGALAHESSARTYVLVHGAYHGGWCWHRVAERLRAAGHRVLTPTNTGLGERKHLMSKDITLDVFVDDVVNVIETEELHRVYLVGHSFGGNTVAGVVDRIPQRIARLVLLDTGIAESGRSTFDRFSPELREKRMETARKFDGGLSFPPPTSPEAFGVMLPEDAAWLMRRMTPHPVSTYTSAISLKHPFGAGLPCTYIRCTQPRYSVVDSAGEYAKSRTDWQYLEIPTGHDAMVTAPGRLADILLALE